MSGIRVLPILVIVCILVLATRVADLIVPDGGKLAQEGGVMTVVQSAFAQAENTGAAPKPAELGGSGPAVAPGSDDPASMSMDGSAATPPGDADKKGTPPTLSGDPTLFTQEEIDLLQNLSARRAELDRKEQHLDERESLIAAAETRIDSKINEMKSLQAAIEKLVKQKDKEDDERITKLISVYEKMKPKDAARIWNDLDMDILLEVAQGMKEANTAAIMAQMLPDRARALTSELARKQDINMLPLQ